MGFNSAFKGLKSKVAADGQKLITSDKVYTLKNESICLFSKFKENPHIFTKLN